MLVTFHVTGAVPRLFLRHPTPTKNLHVKGVGVGGNEASGLELPYPHPNPPPQGGREPDSLRLGVCANRVQAAPDPFSAWSRRNDSVTSRGFGRTAPLWQGVGTGLGPGRAHGPRVLSRLRLR